MTELIVPAVVGHCAADLLRVLLTCVIAAQKERNAGVPNQLAVLVGNNTFNKGIGQEAEDQVASVKVRSDDDSGEEVAMLVETLRAKPVCARDQRVFPSGKAREREVAVNTRDDVLYKLPPRASRSK